MTQVSTGNGVSARGPGGGVNLFDNAEVYGSPRGEAERIMGEAIARLRLEDPEGWRRSDILITTKIFWGGDGITRRAFSKAHPGGGHRRTGPPAGRLR